RRRLDRFEEALQVIRSLWRNDRTTFDGTYYQLSEAVHEPKPVQRPNPPIWIGGAGRKRTLRIAATYADAWNCVASTPEEFAELTKVLDEHCDTVGRERSAVRRTVQIFLGDEFGDVRPLVESYVRVGA